MTKRPDPCYREQTNRVYFTKERHRLDCSDPKCRGCVTCPGRHCTARKNCTWHIDDSELTCGRCINAVRQELRQIDDLAALLPTQAINDGIESHALTLATPAADPRALVEWHTARRLHLDAWESLGRITEAQHLHALVALDDEDEHHPYAVLTRWQMILATDYGHDLPARLTLSGAIAYLGRHLSRMANDESQDFPLLGRELRKCRKHLELVIHNDTERDKGAVCPTCVEALRVKRDELQAAGVPEDEWPNLRARRLERHYAHWCDDEACERRFHFTDDAGDVWRCPTDKAHWWNAEAYANLLRDRRSA